MLSCSIGWSQRFATCGPFTAHLFRATHGLLAQLGARARAAHLGLRVALTRQSSNTEPRDRPTVGGWYWTAMRLERSQVGLGSVGLRASRSAGQRTHSANEASAPAAASLGPRCHFLLQHIDVCSERSDAGP